MRRVIVLCLSIVTVSCTALGKSKVPDPSDASPRSQTDSRWNGFCFIDGRTASCADVERYPHDAIDRIEILRNTAAVERYGVEAVNGAMLLTTKPSTTTTRPATEASDTRFYFIDGRTASRRDVERLLPDSIERIEIMRNAAATDRFGPDAVAGVILVTRKRQP